MQPLNLSPLTYPVLMGAQINSEPPREGVMSDAIPAATLQIDLGFRLTQEYIGYIPVG